MMSLHAGQQQEEQLLTWKRVRSSTSLSRGRPTAKGSAAHGIPMRSNVIATGLSWVTSCCICVCTAATIGLKRLRCPPP